MFIFTSLQIQNFYTISNDLLKLKSDKSKSMNNNSVNSSYTFFK